MSFFWWIFGTLFMTLCIYYLYVASDRHITKRRMRNGAVLRGNQTAVPVVRTNQETVIYTIPTTRQLAQQYPQMVTPYPHQHGGPHPNNGPPPYIDLPPTYEQVVVYPSTPQRTMATATTTVTM